MINNKFSLLGICLSMSLIACSMNVPLEEVYGTYVATYPFGTEAITLNRDGTYIQRVDIKQEQPATVHGTWEYDPKESRLYLYGAMVVTDDNDRLRKNWRTPFNGIVEPSAEIIWFRVVLNDSSQYPYYKIN